MRPVRAAHDRHNFPALRDSRGAGHRRPCLPDAGCQVRAPGPVHAPRARRRPHPPCSETRRSLCVPAASLQRHAHGSRDRHVDAEARLGERDCRGCERRPLHLGRGASRRESYMQSGVLETPPHPLRSSLGITDDGSLLVDRAKMLGQWQGLGPRRALNGLNQRPGAQGISLFTPAWGARRRPSGEPSRRCSSRFRPPPRRPISAASSPRSKPAATRRSLGAEPFSWREGPRPAG